MKNNTTDSHICQEQYNQIINYLAISKLPVGLFNFGENSLKFKRIIF